MRIFLKTVGLISDTHIPSRARAIPPKVFEVFRDVALIIHAGDLVQLGVLAELERLAPVVAVQGNMDTSQVRAKLPIMNEVQVDNFRMVVVHDLETFKTRWKTNSKIKDSEFVVLVSGHSHLASIKWEKKMLLINPGSPTNPMLPFLTKPTVALLKISSNQVEPEIIRIG